MIRRAGWLAAVLGIALLLMPVGPSGGTWSDCGPAATALFRVTEPSDADRFIPHHPEADYGVTAAVACQGKALTRIEVGIPPLLVGALAVVWHPGARRGRSGAAQRHDGEAATATV